MVDELLAKEVKKGYMIGPLSKSPFSIFRVSPIGVATRKYSNKKRLIIDLSAPHNSSIPNINSFIPQEPFSLFYASLDNGMQMIKSAGVGAWPWESRHHRCLQSNATTSLAMASFRC